MKRREREREKEKQPEILIKWTMNYRRGESGQRGGRSTRKTRRRNKMSPVSLVSGDAAGNTSADTVYGTNDTLLPT